MTSGVACPRSSKPSPCRRTPAAAILVCFSSVSVRQKMSIARRHPRTAVDRGVNGYWSGTAWNSFWFTVTSRSLSIVPLRFSNVPGAVVTSSTLDRFQDVCVSCHAAVWLSYAPDGSPTSVGRARRPARRSPGWRSNGNGHLRPPRSPAAVAPRWPLSVVATG